MLYKRSQKLYFIIAYIMQSLFPRSSGTAPASTLKLAVSYSAAALCATVPLASIVYGSDSLSRSFM